MVQIHFFFADYHISLLIYCNGILEYHDDSNYSISFALQSVLLMSLWYIGVSYGYAIDYTDCSHPGE